MALVNKIIRFSCVDGPGNRMVIFFQGCNFACTYCHNPETIKSCIGCGICVPQCPVEALSKAGSDIIWDESKCIDCDGCIRICPHYSSPKVREYTVDELFQKIKETKDFISGITVSGGECTLYADFITELFARVKSELGLTCFVDTNGGVDLSEYPKLIESTDGFMLDVKSIDEDEHMRLTGASNEEVIKNLYFLLEKNKLYEVRTVVADDLRSEATVEAVAATIKDKCQYKLIKYRKNGVRKTGLEVHGVESPSDARMEELKQLAVSKGAVKVIVT